MKKIRWALFAYKIPSEPSSIRVRVWRNLKTLGVHYLQQSVCIFPNKEEIMKKVKKLQLLILENGGETRLLEFENMTENSEKQIIEAFNEERVAEYEEFMKETERFMQEMEQETLDMDFSFREIEENEAALERMKKWFSKIQKRDFFQCESQKIALEKLEECAKRFEQFMEEVYSREGLIDEGNKSD